MVSRMENVYSRMQKAFHKGARRGRMTAKGGTKKEMLSMISYLQRQLDKSFDRIDELNEYVSALKQQIKDMGGEPVEPLQKGVIEWSF